MMILFAFLAFLLCNKDVSASPPHDVGKLRAHRDNESEVSCWCLAEFGS